MTKDIQYNNGCHKSGMLFAFGENQIRVYIKTILEIDYNYTEFDREDRKLTGQDGETEIRWGYSTMNDVDLTATIVDREGRDVFDLCEASTGDHTRDRLLKMVMLEGGETLRQLIMDDIENDGPDQECPYDCNSAWIEALAHNERDSREEAEAAKYPETI